MKPKLADVLRASLQSLGIEARDWNLYRHTRQSFIIRVKELYCLLAYEEGFSHKEIGGLIGHHRTTVLHHINKFKDHCDLYPECSRLVEQTRAMIPRGPEPQRTVDSSAWIARCNNGLLVVSPTEPEEYEGYWIAEGVRPFYPQDAFPQITYEKGPSKVSIKMTLEENEKV